MTRTPFRPLAALALVATILAYVGCTSKTETNSTGSSPPLTSIPAPPPSGAADKLFADWPTPAGALLISGQQDGYLEPCGCTSGQLGGLRRRYDLVERLREKMGWPLALVDLGGLIKNPASARGGFDQVKLKFLVALKALSLLKYDALALSAEDLKIGVDEAVGQFINLGEHPKVVAANVEAPGMVVPSVRKAVGPVKLGITAVLDPEALKKLPDSSKDAVFSRVEAPKDALPAVLADLEKDTDAQVLLVQGEPELAKELALAFPRFEIVVATSHFADPPEDAESLNDGKTLLVTVGQKGKSIGVVGLYPDATPKFRYHRVTLNSRYNGAAEPMRKLIEDDFQAMLKADGVVEKFPKHAYVNGSPGATFVGAERCKDCHPNTFAKWATTKHAHAFEDIVVDPKGRRSDHQFDAECIGCHTTGFEYNSGWRSAAATPYLKGNQCENCHGPASKHAEDPDDSEARKTIARNAAEADKNGFCFRCHDEDNSPKFRFAEYWGQIIHKGMDSYDDPKVHRKQAPKVARRQSP